MRAAEGDLHAKVLVFHGYYGGVMRVLRYTLRIVLAIALPAAALAVMLLGSVLGELAIIGACVAFLWMDHAWRDSINRT